jgi:hypothetical protein
MGFNGSSGAATQTVTPRPITVTAAPATKTYDGTIAAAATPSLTSGTLVAGDTASFNETYNSAAAGASKTLTASVSVDDGNAGGNYAVSLVSALGVINSGDSPAALAPPPINTVAGIGTHYGYTGNGGKATAATLGYPQGVAVDAAGDIFIADSSNNVVREVSATTGNITTIAGGGSNGNPGYSGPATSAALYDPKEVAVSADGTLLYIDDEGDATIRQVDLSAGTISTVAGTGAWGLQRR